MTHAFEKFMRQFEAAGSEKADGYSRDAFIGLEESEKDIVFKLLVSELPWGVEWLFFLDAKKALLVAGEKEREMRGNSYAHTYLLQQQLVKYSGDLTYQKHMIEDYSNYDDDLKFRVIDAVDRTPSNMETVEFFKKVILTEANADAVASASIHLLEAMRIPYGDEEEKRRYDRLIDELRSESTQIKLRALEYISKYGGISQ